MRFLVALFAALVAVASPAQANRVPSELVHPHPIVEAQLPLGPSMLAYGNATSCGAVTAVTFNPADKSTDITLSGGNLIMTSNAANPGADGIARATVSFANGNEYYESRQTAGNNSHFAAGWANATQALTTYLGSGLNGFGIEDTSPGQLLFNSFNNMFVTPPALNTWVGIAYNINLGLVWVTDDGINWNPNLAGTQNPATNSGGFPLTGIGAGPYFPAASAGGDTIVVTGQVNFGATTFAYPNNIALQNGYSPVQAPCAATAATAYSLVGPKTGVVGSTTANFTVQSNGNLAAAVTVTPNDSGNGGSFVPASCPLSNGNATSCQFTYTPANAGTFNIATTNSDALIDPNPISFTATPSSPVNAFIVSAATNNPPGNDANPCSLAAPCLTIPAAINAVANSPTIKTINVRAGTYPLASQINISGAALAGLTISAYLPDGYCSAKIDGGSTADGNGLFELFEVQTPNVTFNGLQFQRYQQAAVKSVGANHGGATNAENTTVLNPCTTLAFSNGTNGGPFSTWGATGFTVKNAVCWNIESHCTSAFITQLGDDWSGYDVENIYVANSVTTNPDMGPIYMWDGVDVVSRTCTIKNNLINTFGKSGNQNKGIYLDDRVSGCAVSYNILVGASADGLYEAYHGGINNVETCNIFDLGNTGNQFRTGLYQDDGSSNMSGNQYVNNLIISYGQSFVAPAWFNLITGSESPLLHQNNIFFNFDSGPTPLSGGLGITDTGSTTTNPLFSATDWTYKLASNSPFLSACPQRASLPPVGYPGFVIPQTTFMGQNITSPAYLN